MRKMTQLYGINNRLDDSRRREVPPGVGRALEPHRVATRPVRRRRRLPPRVTMESAPHLGVHSNSIRVRKSKRSKSASEGNSTGSSDEVCGTCHKCGGSLRRGNTALARQCPGCATRYHASDCGSRLALSGYTGSSDVCPKVRPRAPRFCGEHSGE